MQDYLAKLNYKFFGIRLKPLFKGTYLHKSMGFYLNNKLIDIQLTTIGHLYVYVPRSEYFYIFKDSKVTKIEIVDNKIIYYKWDKQYIVEILFIDNDYYCNFISDIPKNLHVIHKSEEWYNLPPQPNFVLVHE